MRVQAQTMGTCCVCAYAAVMGNQLHRVVRLSLMQLFSHDLSDHIISSPHTPKTTLSWVMDFGVICRLRFTQNLDCLFIIGRLQHAGCRLPRAGGGVKIVDVDTGIRNQLGYLLQSPHLVCHLHHDD